MESYTLISPVNKPNCGCVTCFLLPCFRIVAWPATVSSSTGTDTLKHIRWRTSHAMSASNGNFHAFAATRKSTRIQRSAADAGLRRAIRKRRELDSQKFFGSECAHLILGKKGTMTSPEVGRQSRKVFMLNESEPGDEWPRG